jgi:hypothetical protein
MAVVRPTPQLDVVDRRLPAGGVRDDVVELQEAPLLAAPPVAGDEGAAAAVFRDDVTPHLGRNVAGGIRLTAGLSRTGGSGELPARQVGHQQGKRPVEDLGDVPAGNRVPEQILRVRNFSRIAPLAVKRISYRSGASGRTTAVRGAPALRGVARFATCERPRRAWSARTRRHGADADTGTAGSRHEPLALGTLRTRATTSACGNRHASSSSTACLPLPDAAARSPA